MAVAELAEESLPTPEIRGSNPNIGHIFQICLSIPYSRDDEKKKEAEIGQLKANNHD